MWYLQHDALIPDSINVARPIATIFVRIMKKIYTRQKKFLDTSKSTIFPEMFHIRPIKSTS